MKKKKQRFLIPDANVLIDFIKSDRTIIKLICTYIGQIYLATPVLNEIKEITYLSVKKNCEIFLKVKYTGPLLCIFYFV